MKNNITLKSKNLKKKYGKKTVVKNVSLELKKGERQWKSGLKLYQ